MKLLSFLIALLLCTTLNAQQYDAYVIDLKKQELDILVYPVNISQVVDARERSGAPIGVGHNGLNNHPVLLNLEGGVSPALEELFSRGIQQRSLPGGILRITYLRIDEYITSWSERRRIDVEAEFLLPRGNEYVKYGPVSVSDFSGGLDVTNMHNRALTESLRGLVRLISKEVEANRTTGIMTKEELEAPLTEFPVSSIEFGMQANGIYPTFMHFRAGDVVEYPIEFKDFKVLHTDTAGVEYAGGKIKFRGATDKTTLRDAWGINYGGRAFLNFRGDFYQIQKFSDGTLRGLLPETIFNSGADGNAVFAGGVMFGLIGSAVAAAATTPDNNKLVPTQLDLSTGEVVAESVLHKRNKVGQVALVSSTFNKEKIALVVRRENGKLFVLQPGDYLLVDAGERIVINPGTKMEYPLRPRTDYPRKTAEYVVLVKKSGKVWVGEKGEGDTNMFFKTIEAGKAKAALPLK